MNSDNEPLLGQEDMTQCRSGSEETVKEEDKFDNLMQMSRELAHQLNNGLTSILANAQLMSLILKDEELRPYLKSVEDATRDTGAVVRNFQEAIRALDGSALQKSALDQGYRSGS